LKNVSRGQNENFPKQHSLFTDAKRRNRKMLCMSGKLTAAEDENLCENSDERFRAEMLKYLKRCIEYHQKLLT
jgi:hypothetical protein